MKYNAKLIYYKNSVELTKYESSLSKDDKPKEEKPKRKRKTKEYVTTSDIFNPFTNSVEELTDLDMLDYADWEKEKRASKSFANSTSRTKQKAYSIMRSNNWEWFGTLTFDRTKIDSSDYEKVTAFLHEWLKGIKKVLAPDLKYFIVPELHKDGLHYHFHGLFSNMGNLELVDSGIIQNGKNVYNLSNYKKGFTTFTKVGSSEKACAYLVKYITKDLCSVSKGKKRYWSSRNLEKPTTEYLLLDNDTDIDILIDSLGEVGHIKQKDIAFSDDLTRKTIGYNRSRIYQINQ